MTIPSLGDDGRYHFQADMQDKGIKARESRIDKLLGRVGIGRDYLEVTFRPPGQEPRVIRVSATSARHFLQNAEKVDDNLKTIWEAVFLHVHKQRYHGDIRELQKLSKTINELLPKAQTFSLSDKEANLLISSLAQFFDTFERLTKTISGTGQEIPRPEYFGITEKTIQDATSLATLHYYPKEVSELRKLSQEIHNLQAKDIGLSQNEAFNLSRNLALFKVSFDDLKTKIMEVKDKGIPHLEHFGITADEFKEAAQLGTLCNRHPKEVTELQKLGAEIHDLSQKVTGASISSQEAKQLSNALIKFPELFGALQAKVQDTEYKDAVRMDRFCVTETELEKTTTSVTATLSKQPVDKIHAMQKQGKKISDLFSQAESFSLSDEEADTLSDALGEFQKAFKDIRESVDEKDRAGILVGHFGVSEEQLQKAPVLLALRKYPEAKTLQNLGQEIRDLFPKVRDAPGTTQDIVQQLDQALSEFETGFEKLKREMKATGKTTSEESFGINAQILKETKKTIKESTWYKEQVDNAKHSVDQFAKQSLEVFSSHTELATYMDTLRNTLQAPLPCSVYTTVDVFGAINPNVQSAEERLNSLKRLLLRMSGEYFFSGDESVRTDAEMLIGKLERQETLNDQQKSDLVLLKTLYADYQIRPKNNPPDKLVTEAKKISTDALTRNSTIAGDINAVVSYLNNDKIPANHPVKNFNRLAKKFEELRNKFSADIIAALPQTAQAKREALEQKLAKTTQDLKDIESEGKKYTASEEGKKLDEEIIKLKNERKLLTAKGEKTTAADKERLKDIETQFDALQNTLASKLQLTKKDNLEDEKKTINKEQLALFQKIDIEKFVKTMCNAAKGDYFDTLVKMMKILLQAQDDETVSGIDKAGFNNVLIFTKQFAGALPEQIDSLLRYMPSDSPLRKDLLDARTVLRAKMDVAGKLQKTATPATTEQKLKQPPIWRRLRPKK